MGPAFQFHPFTGDDAEAVAAWKYDVPYAFYDSDADTDDLAMMLEPRNWEDMYYAVEDERGELIGFFQFTREGDTVEIGLGLRPDLTGRGIGLPFVQAGLEFARGRYAPRQFRLSVATFNRRAIRVYERAGFQPVRVFAHQTGGGIYEFVEMARSAVDASH